jgi:hypothetical protein
MKRVLSRIFGPKRDQVTEEWKTLHNEELHNLYTSLYIIRVIQIYENEMGRACSMHGRNERCIQSISWKS